MHSHDGGQDNAKKNSRTPKERFVPSAARLSQHPERDPRLSAHASRRDWPFGNTTLEEISSQLSPSRMILSALMGQGGEGRRPTHSADTDTNAFPYEIGEGVDACFGDFESARFHLTQGQAGSLFHMEWNGVFVSDCMTTSQELSPASSPR